LGIQYAWSVVKIILAGLPSAHGSNEKSIPGMNFRSTANKLRF